MLDKRPIRRPVLLTAAFILVLWIPALARSDAEGAAPISGGVTTDDGSPLAGVWVHSSGNCCPSSRDTTSTDSSGHFRLKDSGTVVFFSKEGFDPTTIVVQSGAREIHVVLRKSAEFLAIPVCGAVDRHKERVGRGAGPQFDVPRELRAGGGKPDDDYVVYTVHSRSRKGEMNLWFGPYAMSPEPRAETLTNSVSYHQRSVINSEGAVVGIDSWGTSRNGMKWRRTSIVMEGAEYENASAEDAELFDSIINSFCEKPYAYSRR
jgi:hypothetical protein